MFNKVFSDLQANLKPFQEGFNSKQLKPVTNLLLIQSKAFEQLSAEQSRFYSDYVELLAKQLENASGKTDAPSLQEAQFNFVQDVQERVGRLFKSNMDILSAAREQASSEVEALKAQVQEAVQPKAK